MFISSYQNMSKPRPCLKVIARTHARESYRSGDVWQSLIITKLGKFGRGIYQIDLFYLLDISLCLSKGCTKCQSSKVYLVVSSKFYESVLSSMGPKPTKSIFVKIGKFLDPPLHPRSCNFLISLKILFGWFGPMELS